MRISVIFFLQLIFSIFLFADDIKFEGGSILSNVYVISKTKNELQIKTTVDTIITFPNPEIIFQKKCDLDKTKKSSLSEKLSSGSYSDVVEKIWKEYCKKLDIKKSYPNLKLLPITGICLFLSFDYFQDANQISNTLNKSKEIDSNFDDSNLQSQKTRKIICGIGFFTAGVINLFISLKSFEIQSKPDKITLSYKF